MSLDQWIVETVKKIEDAKVVVADENMPARLEWASQRVLCPSFRQAGTAVIEFTSVASASLIYDRIGAACTDGEHLLDIWTEDGLARISRAQWLPDTLEWA